MFPDMPQLINPRYERFVRVYLKTNNASEAYRRAGFKASTPNSVWVGACVTLRRPKVKSRIAELRRSMAQKTEISLASLLSDLAEDRALARRLGQASAAVQATTLAAKLTGHLVDRKETGAPGDFAGLRTAAEIMELIRRRVGDRRAAAIEAALSASQGDAEASPILDNEPNLSSD